MIVLLPLTSMRCEIGKNEKWQYVVVWLVCPTHKGLTSLLLIIYNLSEMCIVLVCVVWVLTFCALITRRRFGDCCSRCPWRIALCNICQNHRGWSAISLHAPADVPECHESASIPFWGAFQSLESFVCDTNASLSWRFTHDSGGRHVSRGWDVACRDSVSETVIVLLRVGQARELFTMATHSPE